MKSTLILLAALSLLLAACSPGAGTPVKVAAGATGCAIWADYAQMWLDCQKLTATQTGVIEDHPNGLGHEIAERIRVRLDHGDVLWFESKDIKVEK